MKRAAGAALVAGAATGALLLGCPTNGTVTPPVPADTIFVELIEAGCVDPKDDAGLQAVQLAVVDSSGAPPWWGCLREGGSPSSCGMPCYVPAKAR